MKCLSLLLLIGCTGGERAATGQCPAGETCSTKTPYGLHFIGRTMVDDLALTGPAPTAVGGTQAVALQYDRGDGVLIALDLAYQATDDGGAGVAIDHTAGSVVTVRGAGSRTNYLRILDDGNAQLFDRKQLVGAALDTIALVPTDFETVPAGASLAWAAGDQTIGVALYGQVQESSGPTTERLVDDSLQIDFPGAERTAWDTLHLASATVGTHPFSVTAGDKPAATVELVVVDHADAVAAIQPVPATIATNGSAEVCFAATSQTRFIVGLAWSFVVDGVMQTGDAYNCVLVSTAKTAGMIAVQATAGGQSATISLAVGAMTREQPPRIATTRPTRPTAGERAESTP